MTTASASGPAAAWSTRAFVAHTMGMAVSVHVRALRATHDRHAAEIAAAVQRCFDRLRHADEVFSTYRDDSQLIRIRRGELRESDADASWREVRTLCAEAAEVTGGLFSTDLVGPDGTRGYDPTGLVKGWALERAADVLRGVPGIVFCANAGGDIVAGEGREVPLAVERVWRIGISNPVDPQAVVDVVEVTRGALATSGTAQRGDHIIDPRRGGPATSPYASVTVTGPDLTWADVWATASFIDIDALAFSRMAASYTVASRVPGQAAVSTRT